MMIFFCYNKYVKIIGQFTIDEMSDNYLEDLEGNIMFFESKEMELKREYTRSYLKTVSAFANERNGKIIFGVTDEGEVLGIEDDAKVRQQVENAIYNNFSPVPNFELETQMIGDKKIVVLSVFRGFAIPYLFEGKAYMRTDTSTFVADGFRMRRWFGEISNVSFEDILIEDNELFTFDYLEKAFKNSVDLEEFTEGTLVTLGLKKAGKFTNAGRFFADENAYKFGVDIVKFGANSSEFVKRLRLTNQSIIKQYDEAMAMFDTYYHDYEVISNGERVRRTRLPRNAFREALANAIVHRDYQMNANIQIEFWDTHIKIVSPGSPPDEISEAQYLNGGISVPRNATIANIFYRLNLIETLGTGIGRIKNEYLAFSQAPKFKLSSNIIEVVLPIIDYDKKVISDSRVEEILTLLEKAPCSRTEIQQELGLSASTIKNILAILLEQNKIERFGKARATKYRLL